MYHLITSIALGFLVSIYSCNDASMMSGSSAKRAKSISTNDGDGFDIDGNPIWDGDGNGNGNGLNGLSPAELADQDGNNIPDMKEDKNNNGIADGEEDPDGDGIPTAKDNSPKDYNPDQNLPSGKIFGACVDNSQLPILAEVYRLTVGTKALPNFAQFKKEATVCMANYDVPERDWEDGFDGLKAELVEWFGLKTTTIIKIEEDGVYEFFLKSDDGSRLKINGQQVINNDGEHGAREKNGKITLKKGEHKVELDYFQGPRYRIALQLFWKTPSNTRKEIVPQASFKYTPTQIQK